MSNIIMLERYGLSLVCVQCIDFQVVYSQRWACICPRESVVELFIPTRSQTTLPQLIKLSPKAFSILIVYRLQHGLKYSELGFVILV